ncbi:WD repeat-containing protein 20-like [Acanthaster planci]|uniref:WD repeat-containing protein 20-like n=1 Tax=Acanthaster planci TaxID=133434 RepID=A0A8B7YRX5_ACAPL|nr:WD repeat-containing protein 20-like [Acanthaster planci]
MAASEGGGRDEVKTQFGTREGTYKLMTLSEYSWPSRAPYNVQCCHPVRVSFTSVEDGSGCNDKICFNVGRELYFYPYKGVRKAADLTKPLDKRTYKGGTLPTCHAINQFTASAQSISLLVGFSAGQVQLIDPIRKDISKIYNEERLIDKTKVTCLSWVPGTEHMFLAAHTSGQMYLYNEGLPPSNTPPHYQLLKQGDSYQIHTCKSKSSRNPVFRWVLGDGALNEFAFSSKAKNIACVSQDGFLRVFDYDTMDLLGTMKSYFGGLSCVCWSPDDKYIVVGGEDDLVTVWSFLDRKVVARGHGHGSWVSVVNFDPFTTTVLPNDEAFCGSDDDLNGMNSRERTYSSHSRTSVISSGENSLPEVSYRFGSVGQDTNLCLWEFTEDTLRMFQPPNRVRTNTALSVGQTSMSQSNNIASHKPVGNATGHPDTGSISSKFSNLSLSDKHKDKHKKDSVSSKSSIHSHSSKVHLRLLEEAYRVGTSACPRLDEVLMLEPLVAKKIAQERLTALIFREDCIVTACQEGFVSTWARPGKVGVHSAKGGTVV